MSADLLTQFWEERLSRGDLADLVLQSGNDIEWSEECDKQLILRPKDKKEILNAASRFIEQRRAYATKVSHRAVIEAGKILGLELARPGGKERVWIVPPLSEARRAFEQHFGLQDYFD